MNGVIWKYPLDAADSQVLSMPMGAEILCVQTQAGKPCIWAQVNPDADKRLRTIYTVGTGNPLVNGIKLGAFPYLGTYQIFGGSLVFHVFDGGWSV